MVKPWQYIQQTNEPTRCSLVCTLLDMSIHGMIMSSRVQGMVTQGLTLFTMTLFLVVCSLANELTYSIASPNSGDASEYCTLLTFGSLGSTLYAPES